MSLKCSVLITTLGLSFGFAAADLPKLASTIKIALVGDSTVCNYAENRPDRGWGMFLEEAFKPGSVEVANFAKQGRSTKTFVEEGLWGQTLERKPDYIFIQFGHNDSHAPENHESTNAATDYREFLRRYIDDSRKIGAQPILVTPMVRRTFRADGTLEDNLQPYADAMAAVANEKDVPLIDLHRSSWELVERLGPARAQELANKRGDQTHFNEKGARAMLGLVLRELPNAAPQLAKHLAPDRSATTIQ